jgi:phospholipase C
VFECDSLILFKLLLTFKQTIMSTQQTANVYITNTSDGDAWIQLFHQNSSNGTQSGMWFAKSNQTVGPLVVNFETGIGSFGILDYWCAIIRIQNGSTPGTFISQTGGAGDPEWFKECQLQHQDAGKNLTFSVNSATFNINENSGACADGMTKVAGNSLISNVFVLMLENHSFDNLMAMSGLPGLTVATTANSNSYTNPAGQTNVYNVSTPAPLSMITDPGHEFPDTLEQLGGVNATYPSGGPYPSIDNSGFAANYATTTSEGNPPPSTNIGDIMACFDTANQLPCMYQLAQEFAVCDHWFSSLPGPTWPNRFFLHGASSNAIDYSPTSLQIGTWELPLQGFKYPNGSIYNSLNNASIPYRFYNDNTNSFTDDPQNGSILGSVAQVSSLSGVTMLDINSINNFASDLKNPYPYGYTFIEPNYGDITSTYEGGSSQHPMDDVFGGEGLLKAVYEAIRNSPIWETSMLIVIYDEHGGFYDSVAPPSATAPNDGSGNGTKYGFNFQQYGVRIPAIIASPLIPKGTVDHTIYDHSSVLATLESIFGLSSLTQRDANANNLVNLLSLSTARTDCPSSLVNPPKHMKATRMVRTEIEQNKLMSQPIPESSNLMGFLHIMLKTEYELSNKTEADEKRILESFKEIKTRGQAMEYIKEIQSRVAIAKKG